MTDALGNQVQNTFDGNGNAVTTTRLELFTISSVTTVESFASATFYDCKSGKGASQEKVPSQEKVASH